MLCLLHVQPVPRKVQSEEGLPEELEQQARLLAGRHLVPREEEEEQLVDRCVDGGSWWMGGTQGHQNGVVQCGLRQDDTSGTGVAPHLTKD